MKITQFCFGPFQENTYLLYDDAGNAIIIDPGNAHSQEDDELHQFIVNHHLRPQLLLLTHAHIDHILGLNFCFQTWGLRPIMHSDEAFIYQNASVSALMWNIDYKPGPTISKFIEDGEKIGLGGLLLTCLLAPGHSPGSICFYHGASGQLIGGDVLFYQSIGRTDLPGGNQTQLISSIKDIIFKLPEHTVVWPGHGPKTSVKFEKLNNPFLS
ncbi:MAG: hypothetical protein RIQ89_630 [Bacteroidota bacterium]|jgi:hydroxyacylglutathione hydrolase